MYHRPHVEIFKLRLQMDSDDGEDPRRQAKSPIHSPVLPADGTSEETLRLRFLRTFLLDCQVLSEKRRDPTTRRLIALHQGCVHPRSVQNVELRFVTLSTISVIKTYLRSSISCLVSLDVSLCDPALVNSQFLGCLPQPTSLARLLLPHAADVSQQALEAFAQLNELHCSHNRKLESVRFCAGTLRVLEANCCTGLTDAGLVHATRLEVLRVAGCPAVTDIAPYARTLRELNAAGNCGIHSASTLHAAVNLRCLNVEHNPLVTSLEPFVSGLCELFISANGKEFGDDDLRPATNLVRLHAADNETITTLAPFGGSLRALHIGDDDCRIGDEALKHAPHLVMLDASDNALVTSLAPCASSLRELIMRSDCGIPSEALSVAQKVLYLNVSKNSRITGGLPVQSLRHLVATGHECGVGDAALVGADHLISLLFTNNSKVTTVRFCWSTIERLELNGASVVVPPDELFKPSEVRGNAAPTVEEDGVPPRLRAVTTSRLTDVVKEPFVDRIGEFLKEHHFELAQRGLWMRPL